MVDGLLKRKVRYAANPNDFNYLGLQTGGEEYLAEEKISKAGKSYTTYHPVVEIDTGFNRAQSERTVAKQRYATILGEAIGVPQGKRVEILPFTSPKIEAYNAVFQGEVDKYNDFVANDPDIYSGNRAAFNKNINSQFGRSFITVEEILNNPAASQELATKYPQFHQTLVEIPEANRSQFTVAMSQSKNKTVYDPELRGVRTRGTVRVVSPVDGPGYLYGKKAQPSATNPLSSFASTVILNDPKSMSGKMTNLMTGKEYSPALTVQNNIDYYYDNVIKGETEQELLNAALHETPLDTLTTKETKFTPIGLEDSMRGIRNLHTTFNTKADTTGNELTPEEARSSGSVFGEHRSFNKSTARPNLSTYASLPREDSLVNTWLESPYEQLGGVTQELNITREDDDALNMRGQDFSVINPDTGNYQTFSDASPNYQVQSKIGTSGAKDLHVVGYWENALQDIEYQLQDPHSPIPVATLEKYRDRVVRALDSYDNISLGDADNLSALKKDIKLYRRLMGKTRPELVVDIAEDSRAIAKTESIMDKNRIAGRPNSGVFLGHGNSGGTMDYNAVQQNLRAKGIDVGFDPLYLQAKQQRPSIRLANIPQENLPPLSASQFPEPLLQANRKAFNFPLGEFNNRLFIDDSALKPSTQIDSTGKVIESESYLLQNPKPLSGDWTSIGTTLPDTLLSNGTSIDQSWIRPGKEPMYQKPQGYYDSFAADDLTAIQANNALINQRATVPTDWDSLPNQLTALPPEHAGIFHEVYSPTDKRVTQVRTTPEADKRKVLNYLTYLEKDKVIKELKKEAHDPGNKRYKNKFYNPATLDINGESVKYFDLPNALPTGGLRAAYDDGYKVIKDPLVMEQYHGVDYNFPEQPVEERSFKTPLDRIIGKLDTRNLNRVPTTNEVGIQSIRSVPVMETVASAASKHPLDQALADAVVRSKNGEIFDIGGGATADWMDKAILESRINESQKIVGGRDYASTNPLLLALQEDLAKNTAQLQQVDNVMSDFVPLNEARSNFATNLKSQQEYERMTEVANQLYEAEAVVNNDIPSVVKSVRQDYKDPFLAIQLEASANKRSEELANRYYRTVVDDNNVVSKIPVAPVARKILDSDPEIALLRDNIINDLDAADALKTLRFDSVFSNVSPNTRSTHLKSQQPQIVLTPNTGKIVSPYDYEPSYFGNELNTENTPLELIPEPPSQEIISRNEFIRKQILSTPATTNPSVAPTASTVIPEAIVDPLLGSESSSQFNRQEAVPSSQSSSAYRTSESVGEQVARTVSKAGIPRFGRNHLLGLLGVGGLGLLALNNAKAEEAKRRRQNAYMV